MVIRAYSYFFIFLFFWLVMGQRAEGRFYVVYLSLQARVERPNFVRDNESND
jgi:hypothetical protein